MELNFKRAGPYYTTWESKKQKSCLICELFAEEVQLGNKDNDKKHLNSVKYYWVVLHLWEVSETPVDFIP